MDDIEARRRESQKETAHTPLTDEEKKMVADFEGYLSPLIRCGYTHAIIQLREWAGEFSPVIPSSLLSKLEEMEENKHEVDKALLSKEMEAYTKDRAFLASQLSTARQQLEVIKADLDEAIVVLKECTEGPVEKWRSVIMKYETKYGRIPDTRQAEPLR